MIAGKQIRAKTEENLKTGCFAVKLKHSDGQASYDKNEKLEAELVNYHLQRFTSNIFTSLAHTWSHHDFQSRESGTKIK